MGALDLLKIPSLVRRSGEAASKAKPFYSTVDRAISEITQNKGSGEQFLGMILNKKGVKPQEIKDRGLDKLLTGKMTKADVQRIAAENPPPQVRESVLGEKGFQQEVDRRVEEEIGEVVRQNLSAMSPRDRANKFTLAEVEDKAWEREPKVRRQIEEEVRDEVGFATKYEDYTIPGGKNYREIKFQLPLGKEKIARDARFKEIADELVDATPEQFAALHAERTKLYNDHINNRAFLSSHYEEPNLLAHARVSDRTGPNGEKILHIEEIQSDWHQKARDLRKQKIKELIQGGASEEDATKAVPIEYGYQPADQDSQINALISKREAETSVPERMKMMEQIQDLQRIQESGVPDAPFKGNWHELVMKRLMDDAARNGYDKVLITPGARQVKRYPDPNKTPEEALRGFAGFYDDMLPRYLNSYGKDYGASVKPHSFSIEGEEIPLHAFDITPQMRGDIVEKGQSLYQMAPPAIGAGAMMEPEEKKRGGEIKASPKAFGQDALGRIGQVAEKLGISLQEAMGILAKEGNSPVKAFIGNMLLSDPLKSAGTALQDYTGTPREITADQPYSRLISGKGMNMRLVAQFAVPIGSSVASRAKAVAKGLPDAIRDAAVAAYGPGATAAYAMKPKGGNFLPEGTKAIEKLKPHPYAADDKKMYEAELEDLLRKEAEYPGRSTERIALEKDSIAEMDRNIALNQFIDKQLTRYVKNEMATPEDPIRALAEKGTLHFDAPQVNASDALDMKRQEFAAGNNERWGYGETRLAQNWEDAADSIINKVPARRYQNHQGNRFDMTNQPGWEWLSKVSPDTPLYGINNPSSVFGASVDSLGFNHLIDELRNATNPASGLPRELLLKPESLSRLSVPQAVERVAKINEWRASQKAEADLARARNPATVLHKEYPDKGYSWQELRLPENMELPEGYKVVKYEYPNKPTFFSVTDPKGITQHEGQASEVAALKAYAESKGHPALEDSLKYEGEQMGHCVGGYCPDVASGKSRIFSLRDAKGQPHVTIETRPSQSNRAFNEVNSGVPNPPDSIFQIKGKSNRAPNEEYLPYVQDFVRSGKWSDVGDLQNTGLYRKGDFIDEFTSDQLDSTGIGEYLNMDELKGLREGKPWKPIDRDPELDIDPNILPPMKRGGPVNQDAMNMAVWDKKVQHKQLGGGIKGVKAALNAGEEILRLKAAAKAAGVLPKGQQAVLSAAESNANLEKFLALSGETRRMYHGSKEPNIAEFKTRKDMTDESNMTGHYADERDAVFVSPEPDFTKNFSMMGYTDEGMAPTTYPVYVQIGKPFDFDNPEHLKKVKETYLDMYHNPESELFDPYMLPSERSMAVHSFNKRTDALPNDENNWARIENAQFQDVLKDVGFDSFYTRERGTKNLGVYEPNKIKSAIGNRGTYDIGESDMSKAKGGSVSQDVMRMAVMNKQLRKRHG